MNNVNSSSLSWLKRTGLFLLAALLILAMGIPPLGEDTSLAATEPEYDLGLYIGSPLTISKGEMKPLDSSNLNVAPIIYKDRTLVPLRAIAEHFGAEVSYEAASKAAIIKTGEGTFTFYSGKNYYEKTVAGGNPIRTNFDTEMLIREIVPWYLFGSSARIFWAKKWVTARMPSSSGTQRSTWQNRLS